MSPLRDDGSTVGLSSSKVHTLDPSPRGQQAVAALTVLYHPDLRRVGDRVLLSELLAGREVAVSRHEPELARPGETRGEPLADPHLSRRPFRLRAGGTGEAGGVELRPGDSRTRISTDGEPVTADRTFSAAALAQGVVLELSARVILLLHLWQAPGEEPREKFGLVGESAGLAQVRADIRQVADLDVSVLLRGETGTGKELVAKAIHEASPRRGRGFVGINLGAIPPSLAASELFGAARGSFTGSVRAQEGYFRKAHGGTLFLDEIGETPEEVQVLLLRALETREIDPVGSQETFKVDVRLIAATDSDLEARSRTGSFRPALLHRLSGFEIWLPPLRERRDDIGRLLVHFLREELAAIGEAHKLEPAEPPWLPPEVVARLALYPWPGNVRQLRNVARHLAIGSRGLPRVEIGPRLERLLADSGGTTTREGDGGAVSVSEPRDRPARRKPSAISEEEMLAALRAERWELQAAADRLGISRPSLYLLIERSSRARRPGDVGAEEIARCHRECNGDVEAMVDRLEISRNALLRRLRELKLG